MEMTVESSRPTLVGGEFEEQCLIHAEMGFPLILYSTPGCGKTSKGKAFCQHPELHEIMGYDRSQTIPFACIPAQQATEEHINGFLFLDRPEGGPPRMGFTKPTFYHEAPMVLIIDEVNRAKDYVRSSLYPLLTGDEMINGFKMHPKSLIILIANPEGPNSGTRPLDKAADLRMGHYDWEPVFQDWLDGYARPMGVDPRGIAYLESFPAALFRYSPLSQSKQQPCPRTWTKAFAGWASTRRSLDARKRAVFGAVGREEAEKFFAWVARYDEGVIPTRQQLASGPDLVQLPQDLDAIMLCSNSLGQHLSQPQSAMTLPVARGAAKVLARMAESGLMEPVVLAIRQAMNRIQGIACTPGTTLACIADAEVMGAFSGRKDIMEFLLAVGQAQANQTGVVR